MAKQRKNSKKNGRPAARSQAPGKRKVRKAPVKFKRRKTGPVNKRPSGYLGPKTEVPFQCSSAGRCCWDTYINLTPFDVWRMITSPASPLPSMGVNFTWELMDKDLVEMGVGKEKGMPLCMVKPTLYRGLKGAAKHCPFVTWDDTQVSTEHAAMLTEGKLPGPEFWLVGGKPRFTCSLGEAAPILCQFYPMARVGKPASDGEGATWRFSCQLNHCDECMPTQIKPAGLTIAQWLRDETVREYLRMSQEHQEVLYSIQMFQLPVMVRKRLAATMFNFDGMLKDAGVPEEEIAARRPDKPEHLTMAAKAGIIGMMKGGQFGSPPAK